ncbi:MAG: mechanosensitive ion channel protein [Firmicutes bacterium]|nr:mechanosensitive ion channel protein [Bacillota bacterium]
MDSITSFFQKYPDLEQNLYNIAFRSLKIVLILAAMFIVVKIGNAVIRRVIEKHQTFRFSLDERKSQTLIVVLQSILRYVVSFVGIIAIVGMFGNVGLTLAGIGGVAVGFGSQSLIKDIINGFFILFEDQYSVGDHITIDGKGGIVESIGLRLTRLRDLNGDLHTIPNGAITKVTNHSRGDVRILVDIDISRSADLDRASEAIEALGARFCEENEEVVDCPKVLGISALKDNGLTIRVTARTKPQANAPMEMKLRREIIDTFTRERIEMPFEPANLLKE